MWCCRACVVCGADASLQPPVRLCISGPAVGLPDSGGAMMLAHKTTVRDSLHSQVLMHMNKFIGVQGPLSGGTAVGIMFDGEVSADLRRNTFTNTANVRGRAR